MEKSLLVIIIVLALIINPATSTTSSSQDVQFRPKLFIAGGAMPEPLYKEFHKLTGQNAKLVVIPTASSRAIDVKKIQDLWLSRGFKDIIILHTRDREVASSSEFSEPLKTATAVWFSGGSQQRIADAYLGTLVEKELYLLLQRGGVIGGSSAGAAILSKVMISGGSNPPRITTGLELLPGAIIDQHFLKRNRISRLTSAIRTHPTLIGFGIDEGTAIVVSNNEYKVVGGSYVIQVKLIEGEVKIDAYENGDTIPME